MLNDKVNPPKSELDLLIPLVGFSILAFIMVIGGANIDEPGILSYTVFSAAFLTSSWVCLVAIEKSKFTEWIWSFKSSSIIAGALASIFIFFASMRSSALLNEIFLSDASAMAYTKVIGYVLYAFGLLMPVFLTYLAIAFAVMVKELTNPSENSNDSNGYKVLIFFLNGIVLGLIGGPLSYVFWDEVSYKEKIEAVADFADFGKHSCNNINSDLKAIYLGPNHREVLVKYVENASFGKETIEYIRSTCLSDSANKKIQPTSVDAG